MGFFEWWQNLPLSFDGVLVSILGFEVQYYGFMYLVAFLVCYLLIKRRNDILSSKQLEDLFFGLIASVVVGGRIGYVLFYNFDYYLRNPLKIVWPFSGGEFVGISGMSFHGGLVACLLFGWWFLRKHKVDFWKVSDLIISVAPVGYFLGRIGNFLNNELYGRVTNSPFGMRFLDDPENLRYASQLYQGVLEGLILFVVLSFLYNKEKLEGKLLGVALMWFGGARFLVEFFREPDSHLGLVLGLSRGQFLSFGLILIGLVIVVLRFRQESASDIS